MLQITTTNGDTLIHGDDRPKATIRSYDGSEVIVHAGTWGQHKYIRKEGNRYIYPEDLQKEQNRPQGRNRTNVSGQIEVKRGQSVSGSPVGNASRVSDEMSKVGAQAKLKKGVDNMRRNAAVNEGLATARKELEDRNRKKRDQQHSAHQNAYYYDHTAGNDFYENKAEKNKRISEETKIQTRDGVEAGRKREKIRKSEKESRAGIEEGRRRSRSLEGDNSNRFHKNRAIDDNEEVRKARKKWLGKEENEYSEEDGNTITTNSAAGRSIEKTKLRDSVYKTPHEGAKVKANKERRKALDKAGQARDEYLKARRTAVGIEAGRARKRKKNN